MDRIDVSNPLKVTSSVISLVAGIGVSRIIGGIVKNNVIRETRFQKVTVFAGKFLISAMVTRAVEHEAELLVAEAVETVKEAKEEWAKATSEDTHDEERTPEQTDGLSPE